jgi:uncharacterized protein (TIGR00730 family)
MNISVFGGSQPQPGSPAYLEAYKLGKLLAEAGHTVLTGGYLGTMEGVSRGAAEAGGHVIGVTCEEIENWRPIKANLWVKEEWRRKTLMDRLQTLIMECDAAIALPGGTGTLTELALAWNLMIIHSMPAKPLILVGAGWKLIMESLYNSFDVHIPPIQRDLVHFAEDIQEAVAIIKS